MCEAPHSLQLNLHLSLFSSNDPEIMSHAETKEIYYHLQEFDP